MSDNPKVYFGVDTKEKYYLPETNKEQWIEFKKLKAAQISQYHNKLGELSNPIKNEKTGNYDFVPNSGKIGELDRILIDLSISGYNVYVMENGKPELKTGFDLDVWNTIYSTMDKEISDELVAGIKKLNPSLENKSEKKNKPSKN